MINKITKPFYSAGICGLIFLMALQSLESECHGSDQPAPVIINSIAAYQRSIQQAPHKLLIDVRKLIPTLMIDLRYAGTNNFMHQQIYQQANTTYLRTAAAHALATVQTTLQLKGLGLKIFDAYRPHSATKAIWQLVQDERYAANPVKGSDHNRALAVDLTLVQLSTGAALDMGTEFDNFTDSAHHSFTNLPVAVIKNRKLLRTVMEQAGFKAMETEWWHYAFKSGGPYELLDLSFSQLKTLQ